MHYAHRIAITDPEAFRAAHAFAVENNAEAEFALRFTRMISMLSNHREQAEGRGCELFAQVYKDWAPHSFNFLAYAKRPGIRENELIRKDLMLGGGLIYHGPGDTGSGDASNLTCMVGRDAAKTPHEWAVHT